MATPVSIVGDDLQTILNQWNLDDEDDQMTMPAGWVLTNASGASNMVFYNENPDGMEFGIYSTAGLEEATVFDGSDTPVAKAVVSFDAGNNVVIQWWDNSSVLIPSEISSIAFTGQTFGFWIAETVGGVTTKYYSDADRNDVDGDAIFGEEEDIALLVYNADPGSYVFAGDIDGTGSFHNVVAQAESIKPVPEPATMLLLGCGLIGLASFGRKKFF